MEKSRKSLGRRAPAAKQSSHPKPERYVRPTNCPAIFPRLRGKLHFGKLANWTITKCEVVPRLGSWGQVAKCLPIARTSDSRKQTVYSNPADVHVRLSPQKLRVFDATSDSESFVNRDSVSAHEGCASFNGQENVCPHWSSAHWTFFFETRDTFVPVLECLFQPM